MKKEIFMKAARLIIGIITFFLSLIILFQSCAAGVVNSMKSNTDAGGSAGMFVALISIISGIIAIVCRNSAKGSIVAGAFYAFGGLIGVTNAKVYTDLKIWGILFFIFAVFYIYSGIKQKKQEALAIENGDK